MNDIQTNPSAEPGLPGSSPRIFGIGNAGLKVLEHLAGPEIPAAAMVAVGRAGELLGQNPAREKIALGEAGVKRPGGDGDPVQARALAEGQDGRLRELCRGQEVVFLVCALGGGVGGGVAPMLARIAKEAGAFVVAFVFTPFEIETTRRRQLAAASLAELRSATDGVICLPNQQVCKLIGPSTKFSETFRIANEHLADALRGVWRLLSHRGLIEIHPGELAQVLRESQSDGAFAVCEASGSDRGTTVVRKLLENPALAESRAQLASGTVLISLIAGPELTMAEVNEVMAGISGHYAGAQIVMGASVSDRFENRLSVTLLVSRRVPSPEAAPIADEFDPADEPAAEPAPRSHEPASLPPFATSVVTERINLGLAPEPRERRARKTAGRMQQAQLPLNMSSKGRFDKAEPTIHNGEDLDIPTYVRRGLILN